MRDLIKLTIFAYLILLSSCAVEVGNSSDKAASVDLYFAETSDKIGKSLKVNIESISFISEDGHSKVSVANETRDLNLYEGDSTGDTPVVQKKQITAGKYTGIEIVFAEKNFASLVDDEDVSHSVEFEEETSDGRIFQLNQDIEIVEGQDNLIVFDLDTKRSFNFDSDKKKFKFKPRGEFFRHDAFLEYSNDYSAIDGTIVCAYRYTREDIKGLFAKQQRSSSSNKSSPLRQDTKVTKQRLSKNVDFRRTNENFSEISFDETSSCTNAYASTKIKNKEYTFKYLKPGFYNFRIFKNDGSFADQKASVIPDKPSSLHNKK